MPVTEIYSCKEGQKLKDGKLDLSHDITSKEQAQGDAKRRCKFDPSIKKIAYYSVTEDGRFRNFFTYTNPVTTPVPKKVMVEDPVLRRSSRPRSKPPQSLLARLMAFLGLGD